MTSLPNVHYAGNNNLSTLPPPPFCVAKQALLHGKRVGVAMHCNITHYEKPMFVKNIYALIVFCLLL